MNNSLRARIAALEGPPPTVIPTVVIVMKDGTRKEMTWNEAMMTVLGDDVADIRMGNDADMMNLCRAMCGGDDHAQV
jgi:hypothetical protein